MDLVSKQLLLFILIPFFSYSQSGWNMNLLGTYNYPNTQGNDIWGWVDDNINEEIYIQMENGEVMLGERYIITFYLKKNRVFEGGLDWGEWQVVLTNYLLDIRKL